MMKYQQGTMGRVFLARAEHGEDPLEEMKKISKKENIRVAVFFLLGALKGGSVVTGPKEPVLPPVPNWFQFDDGREVLGLGTLLYDQDEPALHLHGGLGREQDAVICCLRDQVEVYITVEVVILELSGIDALREFDPASGQKIIGI